MKVSYTDIEDAFFKEFLESKGLLQKWYDFENDAAIRDWCNANDIELDG